MKKPYIRLRPKCGGITLRHPRLYDIWRKMVGRCTKVGYHNYENYGARGITVCDEWRYDAEAFVSWAYSNGYDHALTIERIDNNAGYSPLNCKWATALEQGRNKRNNIWITYKGETRTVSEWARFANIRPGTMRFRLIRNGGDITKVLGE